MVDRYIGSAGALVTLDGSAFRATVHVAQVEGKACCVGIDLRSVEVHLDRDEQGNLQRQWAEPLPGQEGWPEVNTRVWRALQVGEVVKKALQGIGGMTLVLQPDTSALLAATQAYRARQERPGSGRPARYQDPELLAAVARAHGSHGRGDRLDAVRVAMEDHPAFRRGATLDQAKKAVRAARDAGLIAPTARANARKAQA